MATRFTYRMTHADGGYRATCDQMPVESVGSSREKALEALRDAIAQRLRSSEAVAPPSHPSPSPRIELVEAGEAAQPDERDPQGPGDSPAAETPRGS